MFRAKTSSVAGALAALALIVGGAAPAAAQYENEEILLLQAEIEALSATFPAFAPIAYPEEKEETAFVYADRKGIVHHYVSDRGNLREKWKSFPLDGTIRALFAEDLDRNGRPEIVAYTSAPKIYVFGTAKYELLWESVEEKFETISAMAVADVDRDPALELVVVADNKVVYYDGVEFFREREGRDFVEPGMILVADVDNDGADEIVTNDGYVLDTSTLNIEWATDGFGYPISLFDLDNDGVLEIVGETSGALTFWDVEDQREIW